MDRSDIKEKLIILGITTGIFLPIRVLFTAYVSEHWLGSLGLVSAFGLLFVVLIKQNKLGWFGRMFEKQMKKTIGGKTGKYIIFISVLFLIYFGTSLYFIDKGNTVYFEDKEIFSSVMSSNDFTIENIPVEKLNGPQPLLNIAGIQWITNFDYALSIAYAIMDDTTDGWLSHFIVVVFVEQLEMIGLLCFYRNTFKHKISVET
jgi:hypothetical protein